MRGQTAAAVRSARGGTRLGRVFLLVFLLIAAGRAIAEDSTQAKKPHGVPRATSEVTIDGVLDEQAWQDALTLELDYEVRPGENIEPPVRTVVFITYDEDRVLVAFRAYDPEPEKIRAR